MPIRMDVLDDIERRGREVREREIAKFKADGAKREELAGQMPPMILDFLESHQEHAYTEEEIYLGIYGTVPDEEGNGQHELAFSDALSKLQKENRVDAHSIDMNGPSPSVGKSIKHGGYWLVYYAICRHASNPDIKPQQGIGLG